MQRDFHNLPLPSATRFQKLTRIWLLIIPVLFSNEEEVWNDEATADDLKDEQDDKHDVHKVEILSDQK